MNKLSYNERKGTEGKILTVSFVLYGNTYKDGITCKHTSKVQAISWAKSVARRRRIGNAIINEYNFDEKIINDLKILKFDSADGEWLDFVVANRKELPIENKYDLVIGPVASR